MDLLLSADSGCVHVGLHRVVVLSQELEVDLVLGFVTLEGGEVDVVIEAAGVTLRAADPGAECAVEEAGSGAPSRAATLIVGDVDLASGRGVEAGFGGVVDGDFLKDSRAVERWDLGHWGRGWEFRLKETY
ncbi:hypothetical protein HPP92_014579 [Vanilla planifolia]|uniref:Uncharacterized protein n=1 Tax=Vanilla planifolia TaxID=51239 RepID=A0A835QRW7_VANPL|nr:hypothetical protein HPP92_014579 [Vanilla planifolia]